MSQHYFQTSFAGTDIHILMGWDRPLQGFFLVVQKGDVEEDIIYSNLEDKALKGCRLPKSIAYFEGKLVELGLRVPPKMIEEIKKDAATGVGNRLVRYDANGNITEDR